MFTIYSESDAGSTAVPNAFIDEYMRDANDAQLKIYLYLLRTKGAGGSTCISDIADRFNHTEREVLRSLRYWEKRGILTLEYDDNNEVAGICLNDLRSAGKTGIQRLTLPNHQDNKEGSGSLRSSESSVPETAGVTAPPQHRPDEAQLEEFRGNRKRAQLLFVIEQYIGKPLSPGEVQSVCYISEELHFSDALIDYLLQYCIDRGKKDFRYIEKVAINWAENGITTPKQAERAVSPLRKNRRGQGGVRPSSNKFNQFEQNHYDFEELEREILGS